MNLAKTEYMVTGDDWRSLEVEDGSVLKASKTYMYLRMNVSSKSESEY